MVLLLNTLSHKTLISKKSERMKMMTPQQLEENMKAHFESKSEKRLVRNITAALMRIFNIPPDNSLVCLIGCGHERNNSEALEYWVTKELKKFPSDIGDQLDYLYARFRCEFAEHLSRD
jgi:hypothetical protein